MAKSQESSGIVGVAVVAAAAAAAAAAGAAEYAPLLCTLLLLLVDLQHLARRERILALRVGHVESVNQALCLPLRPLRTTGMPEKTTFRE